MRRLLLGFAVAAVIAASCYDGLAPPAPTDAGVPDLPGGVDLAGGDGNFNADGGPSSCATACDCNPGERCEQGTCKAANVAVYCCGSATCPGSSVCQQPNGKVGQCDLNPDAGFTPVTDGGTASGCATQPCSKGANGKVACVLACGTLTADCVVTAGTGEHCMP
ncbi:MAG TPA: hypothetical protein VFF06_23255 [Polyangia bacterium]|nr:hypothetical protein [Polyangia bacterium]